MAQSEPSFLFPPLLCRWLGHIAVLELSRSSIAKFTAGLRGSSSIAMIEFTHILSTLAIDGNPAIDVEGGTISGEGVYCELPCSHRRRASQPWIRLDFADIDKTWLMCCSGLQTKVARRS